MTDDPLSWLKRIMSSSDSIRHCHGVVRRIAPSTVGAAELMPVIDSVPMMASLNTTLCDNGNYIRRNNSQPT